MPLSIYRMHLYPYISVLLSFDKNGIIQTLNGMFRFELVLAPKQEQLNDSDFHLVDVFCFSLGPLQSFQ